MNIVKANSDNIKRASGIIKSGGLVAFPTETVYGLGANGLDPIAAAKIFEVKERPSFNPLILHIASLVQFRNLTTVDFSLVEKVIEHFWPGPLTLVVPKSGIVPDIITAGNDTVAIRMPDHPVAQQLLKESKTPIAAPSANKFTQLSPTTAQHVRKQLGDDVELILDDGPCKIGVESTILKVSENGYELLRPGGIGLEDIEKIVGEVTIHSGSDSNPIAPGMLPYHYAPTKPIDFLSEENIRANNTKKVAALYLQNINENSFYKSMVLSPSGNLLEASANLFAYLHKLENEPIDIILVEPVEEKGLGRAIMDRLKKAAKKYE